VDILDQHLERPEVHAWVVRCFGTGFNHGAELASSITMTDGVVIARDILAGLEKRGWILRGKHSPTRDQRFFDVQGLLSQGDDHYTEAFGWEPVRDSADAYEFVGGARPEFLARLRAGETYADASHQAKPHRLPEPEPAMPEPVPVASGCIAGTDYVALFEFLETTPARRRRA